MPAARVLRSPRPVRAGPTRGHPRNRIGEAGALGRIDRRAVKDLEVVRIGPFDVEFIPVTHSVPHAHAIAVGTAQGIVLHSGDWKLDLDPVDGRRTELSRLGQLTAGKGVRLLMADSTNAEEAGYAPSETSNGPVLRGPFADHPRPRTMTPGIVDAMWDTGLMRYMNPGRWFLWRLSRRRFRSSGWQITS